jgi:hypothetical protein
MTLNPGDDRRKMDDCYLPAFDWQIDLFEDQLVFPMIFWADGGDPA